MAQFTRHARQRSIQRCIPETAVDLLLDYGDIERAHGVHRYVFNAPAKRRLRNQIGRTGLRAIERYFGIYAIVGDTENVVTVSWRRRRYRRRPCRRT